MSDALLGHGRRPAGIGFWPDPADDPGVALRREPLVAVAADGGVSRGLLWLPPPPARPATVVALTHPRADFSVHYACPLLAAAGYAVCGFATRYLNNDTDCVHEQAVGDVRAMVAALRQRFERVVLLGNSGGGSLMSLAIATAEREGDRLAEAFVAVAAHPGQGAFMLQAIDPSVADEDDPFSVDRDLDMYDPANGWRPWPAECRYDPEWVLLYRQAQVARVARIDARARAALADRDAARADAAGEVEASPAWLAATRRALFTDHLRIWRTLADPAYLDLSMEPDDRPLGSIFAPGDPMAGNWGRGLARVMTPRGWLSTWSGLSSAAAVLHTIPTVTAPTLVVHATADTEIRLGQAQAMFEGAGAADKRYVEVAGARHYFEGRRRELVDVVTAWLGERGLGP